MKICSAFVVSLLVASTAGAAADSFSLTIEQLMNMAGPAEIAARLPARIDVSDAAQRRKIAEGLLGLGYDVWLHKATQNRCVKYPPNFVVYVTATQGVASKDNWSILSKAENYSEDSSNRASSAGLSLTYKAFSLGASHSSAESNHFSSYSRYITVDKGLIGDSASVIPAPNTAAQIEPTKPAIDAMNAKNFASICGQAYVAKVSFGEHISGTLDYATTMNENASSNATAVSAGVSGIINGTFSTSQQYDKLASQATLSYNVTGGPPQDADPAKWIDKIRSYGADGKFNIAKSVILIETNPYSGLNNPTFKDFVDADQIGEGTVESLRAEFMNGTQLLSDLFFAQTHAAQFTKTPPATLTTQIKTMSDYLDAVGAVYDTCRKAVDVASAAKCKAQAATLKRPDYIPTPPL